MSATECFLVDYETVGYFSNEDKTIVLLPFEEVRNSENYSLVEKEFLLMALKSKDEKLRDLAQCHVRQCARIRREHTNV